MTTNGELRFRKRELFRMLGYEPHAGQVVVHRSTANRRVLACGTRWGKSTCGAMECVAALMQPREEALGWLVGPTFELTDRIFRRVVQEIQTRFEHRVRLFSPREHRLAVRNLSGGTSELRAKSADRPESLLGESLDFLVVDEAASLRDNVWDEFLAARLIDKHGWSLCLSTPQECNWFFSQFRLGRADPLYESWQAPSIQNPHIDRAVIEAERARLTPEIFAQHYEAEFIGAPLQPCLTCGGPSEGVEHFLLLHTGEEPHRCPTCGEYVHEDGRTAVTIINGRPTTNIVIEHGVPWDPPELPV